MDENLNKDIEASSEKNEKAVGLSDIGKTNNNEINSFIMDDKGKIRRSGAGGTAVLASSRTFIVLGWISAALTLLVSPYFAAAGITFGLLANKRARGSGNYIIIANIAFGLINFILGLFLIVAVRRMILGY